MQDYSFCMKAENNQDDEGTLPHFKNILNFDWASRDAAKIKSDGNFEKHDQLFTELGTQYLVNATQNYMKHNPEALDQIESQEDAIEFVSDVLKFSKIEYYFSLRRSEDEDADDMLTYARDVCSRLVLSFAIDKCETMEDSLGLCAIR